MAKSKDSTPKTAPQYAERAGRHRTKADELRQQVEAKQTEVEAATREERDTAGLRDELRGIERELFDTETAAAADEREAERLRLLEEAAERRQALEQLDKLRAQYEAVNVDAAVQAVVETVGQQQSIEARVRELMDATPRDQRQWATDWCERAAAARIMHGLREVLDPGAFANTRPSPEQHGEQSWRQAERVIGNRASDLEAQAEQMQQDSDDGEG